MGRPITSLFVVAAAIAVFLAAADGERTRPARAAAPKLKVVLVVDSAWRTSPFEQSMYDGLRLAVRELGVEGRLVVRGPKEALQSTLLSLARRRIDLIVTTPFFEPQGLDAAARAFPEQRFLSLDYPIQGLRHRPANVEGTIFRVEEPSYLAGYLAGLMEKRRPGKDVVSSVGGVKAPQVDRFIAGFQAGARAASPSVVALNGYSNNFLDVGKCRQVALHQIAKGSGVVFQVAGPCGRGALAAAKEHGVFGVGVDADQSGSGPHILTSVLKRLDVAVYRELQSFVRGSFKTGGNDVFTLENGGVGLGKISPRVPRALLATIEAVRQRIVSSKIRNIPTTVP